jgi:hypothetical protein
METLDLIEIEAKSLRDRAGEMSVTCDEEYANIGGFVLGCKQLIAKIKQEFAEPKKKAFEAHRAITAFESRTLEPVETAMSIASSLALIYKREQDRLAKAEADAIEAERQRAAEQARLTVAEHLESLGKTAEAAKALDAPVERQKPFVSPVPKITGLSTRGSWRARIVNARLVNRDFCAPDPVLINLHVNRLWGKGAKFEDKTLSDEQRTAIEAEIGGVEIFFDEGFTARLGK